MIYLSGYEISEAEAAFILAHKGEPIYRVDERDDLFDSLDEAKEYGESLASDGWVGDLTISEYTANISYDDDVYNLDDANFAPLADTGRYWTLTSDGLWHKI